MTKKSKSKIYYIWQAMLQRCYNKNNAAFKNYGDRGIFVCDRWKIFDTFLYDMGTPNQGWTLDRINNNLGYFPENCVWSKRIAQIRNRRNTKTYEVDGKYITLKEYANSKNLNYNSLKTRLQKGLPIQDVLFDGKFPNNNIYGKDKKGKFIKKDFHGRLCAIEERRREEK
jgi:hypothetical protein